MIPPLPHIGAMAPYALAQMDVPEGVTPVSLSQNESLRPPSPAVAEAVNKAARDGALYPDPDWTALRVALAAQHGMAAGRILVGSGSLDLIGCLARAFTDKSNAILAPRHAYPFFRVAAAMTGARFDEAHETDLTADIETLLNAVRPDTRVVFIANPGNPTGTRVSTDDLMRLRDGLRDDILLVIDEAYGEFADHLDRSTFSMVEQGYVVVLRTFSKAYGLAGYRVGWGVFPDGIAAEMRKVMNPNNVSATSQAAAVAALEDQAYMRETCALTADARARFTGKLRDLGFQVADAFTNFVLVQLPDAQRAADADAALKRGGIIARGQTGAGLAQALRITVGPRAAMDAAEALLAGLKEGDAR